MTIELELFNTGKSVCESLEKKLKQQSSPGTIACAFSTSTQDVEAGDPVSLWAVRSTE